MRPATLRATLFALALMLGALPLASQAQLLDEDPDKPWQEGTTALPSALNTNDLVPIDMPGSSLKFGVDPQSIQVGADGVNRYVVVATSSGGAVNAMYEGVRCKTGEVKLYARYAPGEGWKPSTRAAWQSVFNNPAQRHSLVIARSGMCDGVVSTRKVPDIVRDLRSPPSARIAY